MIIRRIVAVFFDIALAFGSSAVAGTILGFNLYETVSMSLIVYLFHTSLILLVSRKQTIGERYLKIQLVLILNKGFDLGKSLISNAIFCFFVYVTIVSKGPIEFLLTLGIFISTYAMIFFKNKYEQSMSGVDYLLHTCYQKQM